jgi:tetratricopeptide (TPR) repeat protein
VRERVPQVGAALVIAGIAITVLALGGAHPFVLLASAPLLLVGCAAQLASRPTTAEWPAPCWLALGLAAYTLAQAVPLPIAWLSVVSERSADVWARALYPFGEPVAWGAVSLDPGASVREALKWALYAVVFATALRLARRFGTHFLALVLLGLGLALACSSLGHRILGAERVFGLYAPLSGAETARIGPLLNPNALSGCLNLTGYVGLGLAFSRRIASLRWVVAVATAIIFAVSVLSGSRGGAWTLPLGLSLFGVIRIAYARNTLEKRRIAWSSLVFGVCAAIFVLLAMNEWTRRALLQDDVEKLKMAVWVGPLLSDYWLLGVGRGAFESVFPSYAPPLGNLVYSQPENLVLLWLCEWGVPVGALALSWFAKQFWSIRTGVLQSSVRSGAAIGALTIVVHNLLDFSLELPGVALCFVLAVAVVWAPRAAPQPAIAFSSRSVGGILITCGLVWAVAASVGRTNVEMERAELHRALPNKMGRDSGAFFSALRRAMYRHPAEPYFSRLGAIAALEIPGADAMPWIQRALECGMNEARSHLLAARALAKRGALQQALFELGLAVQLDVGVAPSAAGYAAAWGSGAADIERIAPPGRSGAVFLTEAATRLKDEEQRATALRAAVGKDTGFLPPRLRLLALLVQRLERSTCAEACRGEIAHHVEDIARLSSTRSTRVLNVLASAKEALGDRSAAYEILRAGCSEIYGPTRAECFVSQLRVAERLLTSSPAELTSVARRIADEACLTAEECAPLLDALGTTLQNSGVPGVALEYLEKATTLEPTAGRFLKAAEVALQLGRYARAGYLLRAAEQAARANDETALLTQVLARRDELSRKQPLP